MNTAEFGRPHAVAQQEEDERFAAEGVLPFMGSFEQNLDLLRGNGVCAARVERAGDAGPNLRFQQPTLQGALKLACGELIDPLVW